MGYSESDFKSAFERTVARVSRSGLAVEIGDVLDPNTGDLDGKTIMVDHLLSEEDRLFVLVHLFGHCVQWNVSAEARTIGQATYLPTTAAEYQQVRAYEKDASRYGLRLLHEAGVVDLDQWLTDLWQADWLFLEHFYRTGERVDPRSFYRADAAPPLESLEVPPFEPRAWPRRFAF